MKKCPQCRRDYSDDSLSFCLDDGARLLDGPGAVDSITAFLLHDQLEGEAQTRPQINSDSFPGSKKITSNAEYLVSRMKRRKLGVLIVAALAALTIAAAGFGIYKLIAQKTSELSFQSAKYTHLTSTGQASGVAISPDGIWLAHVVDDGGRQSLWLRQVAIPTSNSQIVAPAEISYTGVAFSPDGDYIYYSARTKDDQVGSLYQMSVLGTPVRKLFTGIYGCVGFSPDGKHIAFFRREGDQDRLMIADADGANDRQLLARSGSDYFSEGGARGVAWSPDGKTLASSIGDGTQNYMSVVTISPETGEIFSFTSKKWHQVDDVAWLADGKSILVTATDRNRDPFKIWQLTYPTGEARTMTNELNSYPALSLTSAFNVLATVQSEEVANIWVMPTTDTAHAIPITQGRSDNIQPAWTPDGKIIYVSSAGDGFDLYLTDAHGGSPKQLTTNAGFNGGPSVSPDGRYIVFRSDRTGAAHIWRMDLDGGNAMQLTNGSDYAPRVSPDSQWVTYLSESNGSTPWKVSINGGQPVQLSEEWTDQPQFSPDEKQIACFYRPKSDSAAKLAILPFEGGRPIKAFDLSPSFVFGNLRWSADARSLVYTLTTNGVSNLWSQSVDGGAPKQLTNFTSDHIFWFDISRDGKIALSRGTKTSDVVLIKDFGRS